MRKRIIILPFCLWLCACDQGDQTKSSKPDTTLQLPAPLPTDPMLAAQELEKRLDESVKVSDGLVFVRDPVVGSASLSFLSVLPATTPWVLSCGIGVSVVFGSAVSGEGENISNDVNVILSTDLVENHVCDAVGSKLGKRLQTMLQSRSAPD